jgi:NAD(P)-dependent dehydrogenase (short-subunit alcohol dehydrogenase family)
MELEGRLALVTGAGVRLGRALAEGLAGQGMRLALHYHQHAGEAEELALKISRAAPSLAPARARCFPADLGQPDLVGALCESVETEMGPVDALLLSAAIYPQEPLETITPAAFERTLRINLTSPFLLALNLGLRMQQRGGGRIIAILDWSLDRPYPDRVPYTAAKAGLRAAILGLARALAPEVQVNAIAPGAILLPEGTDAVFQERVRGATPLGRIGRPSDLVEAAVFLLRSEFITGTVLTVDGGRSIT